LQLEFSRNVDGRTEHEESRYTEEQIIGILKQHEAGVKTADLCREHGMSEATFYNWKAKFGGLDVSEAQRLRQMDDDSRRLKQLVADLSLDKEMLKTVIRKTAGACRAEERRGVRFGGVRPERAHGLQAAGCGSVEFRYAPRRDRNAGLWEELVKLARQKPRVGYRRREEPLPLSPLDRYSL
jgi:putative transposase